MRGMRLCGWRVERKEPAGPATINAKKDSGGLPAKNRKARDAESALDLRCTRGRSKVKDPTLRIGVWATRKNPHTQNRRIDDWIREKAPNAATAYAFG
jgi:hypothetical protein